jgi:hypothetical protein
MAHLQNRTPFVLEGVPLIDREGWNVFVVILKATFDIGGDATLRVSEEQEPIWFSDQYIGQPKQTVMVAPSDCIDHKPAADIIVLQPGALRERTGLFGWKVSIEIGRLKKTNRIFKVWPFGPVGRNQKPRSRYSGTYDQTWVKSRMPLLPTDFDARYNLAAHADQIVSGYLKGDEHVKLSGLYPDGAVEFDLPGHAVVIAGNVMSRYFTEVANLDTLVIWSDLPKIAFVWRHPIRCKKIAEVCNVFVDLVRRRTATEVFGKP